MSKFLMTLALLVPLSSSVFAAAPEPEKQAPVMLEYTYQIGEPVRYRTQNHQSMIQVLMDQIVQNSETRDSIITRELLETREDGTLVVAERYEQFGLKEKTPGGDFSYDSTNPDDESKLDDPRVRSSMASFDWVAQLMMTPQGEVVGLANEAELAQRAEKVEDLELRQELLDDYSVETQINNVNPFTKLLPDKPVSVGDSWQISYVIDEDPMMFSVTQTMTVASIIDWKEGKFVRVDIVGNIDFDLPQEFPEFMKITDRSIKGRFVFNTHLGTVTDYQTTMSIGFGGSPGEGMPGVSISSTLTSSYEIIRD